MAESYDVIVVGAGPAGSRAAQAAAERGGKVLLIDWKQRIGVPVQCGEFVPRMIARYADFSPSCILQHIKKMRTHLSDGDVFEMKSPGYMIDRSLFDRELVALAALAGAEVSIGTRGAAPYPEGMVIERGPAEEAVRTKVIIGADGVHSSVARWAGCQPGKTMVTLQYEVVISTRSDCVDVFFHPDYEGGYAWYFPKGRTANVGIGVTPQKTALLSTLLNDFLDRLLSVGTLSRINVVGKTGGSIPCEPLSQTVFGNILLAGDAAGQTHPITGAGILNAVMAGEIAGRVAAEAVARDDPAYLKQYEIEWRESLGESLSYGALKRKFLEENWNRDGIDFKDLIRKNWVGFKEYYKDRKRIPLHPSFSKGERKEEAPPSKGGRGRFVKKGSRNR